MKNIQQTFNFNLGFLNWSWFWFLLWSKTSSTTLEEISNASLAFGIFVVRVVGLLGCLNFIWLNKSKYFSRNLEYNLFRLLFSLCLTLFIFLLQLLFNVDLLLQYRFFINLRF